MQHKDAVKSLKSLKRRLTKKKKTSFCSSWENEDYISKSYCTCKDSHGNPKYLYPTEEALKEIQDNALIKLKSYPCPSEHGWHLTKV